MIFSGLHDEVIEETSNWKDFEFNRETRGLLRASAIKRTVERARPEERVVELARCCGIMGECFRSVGVTREGASVCHKVLKDLTFEAVLACGSLDLKALKKCLEFFYDFGSDIVAAEPSGRSRVSENLKKLRQFNVVDNPFGAIAYEDVGGLSEDEMAALLSVDVYYIPKASSGYEMPPFMFAEDKNGEQFFLSVSNLRNGDDQDWSELAVGCELLIRPSKDIMPSDKARPAEDIYLP